jgi:transposase InsO family protein
MPWKETRVMDEKIKMISNWLSGEYSITKLSRIHEVSRKTVYKWLERYEADQESGLHDRSSKPLVMPKSTPSEVVADILAAKSRYEHWGSRKLLAWLKSHQPEKSWPAASTTSEILKRHGMVRARRKRHHTPPYNQPFSRSNQPNEVWCADFKGQFRLGTGKLCYPLTLTDSYSRFLLGCWGLIHPAYLPTRYWFERAFREYGLPGAIRTDNGVPFASVGLGGLSSLAVWFVKLGIYPERIEKGHPEQNGRHERMHRTLKAEAVSPPRKNMKEQQRVFDRFRATYNLERPHEALGQKTPASIYQSSKREYPAKLPESVYAQNIKVRQVKHSGCFKWQNHELYLSGALAGELIGLKEIDNDQWAIFFNFYPLGILDERTLKTKSC